jgi:hypothetical protein
VRRYRDAAPSGGSPDELRRALAEPAGGVEVVVAAVDRSGRRALDERLAAVADSTLRKLLGG